MQLFRPLRRRLRSAPAPVVVGYGMAASFAVYFFMFAFRKPFAAAEYEGLEFFGTEVDLKTALVVSQIAGYGLAKYAGIKFCSEMPRRGRAAALVACILAAEAALVLFGLLPPDWKVAAIFLNGFPLGMVWGLIVWYLEGRRRSEILLAGMSCSYILASGAMKTAGSALVHYGGVPETWMPAAAGLCFLPAFLLAVWLLDQFPEPDAADVEARVEREPMDGPQRLAFLGRFWVGLAMLLVVYFFLNAFREYRDNFAAEIFHELGHEGKPALFAATELPVAFGVLAALAGLNLIRDNRRGLLGAFAIITAGVVLLGASTWLLDRGRLGGVAWMVLVGLGTYLAYVPFGSVLFDRMIASTGTVGTAVFAIYVADALGYTGSIGVMLFGDLAAGDVSRLDFFRGLSYFMAAVGTLLLAASCAYFLRRSG